MKGHSHSYDVLVTSRRLDNREIEEVWVCSCGRTKTITR